MVGIVAAVPTILLLCLAGASYRHVGGWTPMYSVVSVIDSFPLRATLARVAQGEAALYYQQPFMVGVGICLALGALGGAGFAFGVRRHPVRRRVPLLTLGVAHGLFCMGVFYLGALFLLGQLTGQEFVASSLARTVGWPTLIAAHALYGLVLGLWYYHPPVDLAPATPWAKRT